MEVNEIKYEISLKSNKRGDFIRIKSLAQGGHSTDYFHYFERASDGALIERELTKEIAPRLIERVYKKGPTEGFILNKFGDAKSIIPEDILHQKTQKEVNFTSTGEKLDFHWPIFEKLKETGFGSIIRATLTLHQVCASRCQFCSTINRNKKDSISRTSFCIT